MDEVLKVFSSGDKKHDSKVSEKQDAYKGEDASKWGGEKRDGVGQ